jgi:hypothetical protein
MTAQLNRGTNAADRVFFGGMGFAMNLTVFLGFAPTYYLIRNEAPPLTPLLHGHAFFATTWMLLFMTQTGLIAAHRADLHRRLGVFGAIVAAVLTVLLTMTSIASRGFTNRLVFSAGAILMFVIYVAAGLVHRRRPDAHKRLMLLATISLLAPAISRLKLPFLPSGSIGPNMGALLFLLPAFAYDFATLRRIHPALLWGGLFMIAMLPLRALLKDYVF